MRLALIFLNLTFVLVNASQALPDSELGPPPINTKPTSPQSEWGASLLQSRKNSDHTLSFSLGEMAGFLVDKGEFRRSSFVSIQQTNYNRDFTAQEYGVELLSNGQVGLNWGFKTLMMLGKSFEPFYKYGFGGLYKTTEGLGSFINYERYQARVAMGVDDLLSLERQLRAEAGVAYSVLGVSYFISIGYAFGD